MAIVQISQITNRLGLAQDLPQLAGGELGWSVDTRQLYIGNGTLAEGAPIVGNTEILTEFSDILEVAAAYTYKGTAAGYTVQTGPTASTPVVQSLQSWLDQFASVKDFGAVGDGDTDDTAAINRALFQLYCRQANPQVRRALFFPAGVYKVTSTINIPPYATLVGDGLNASIIQLQESGLTGSVDFVAQTASSLQRTGADIGTGGALPTKISINNITFQSLNNQKSIFLVQQATDCEFRGVAFIGSETTATIPAAIAGSSLRSTTAGVKFGSEPIRNSITTNILFDNCKFTKTVYGVYTAQQTKGVVITNSSFDTLYQGVSLSNSVDADNGGPTGTRITNNVFDNIFREGIVFGRGTNPAPATGLNASAYNIFYNVGNDFDPAPIPSPTSSIVRIVGDKNVSIGDMFARSNLYATNFPQVEIGDSLGAILNNNGLIVGSKTIKSGESITLLDAQTGETAFSINVGIVNPSVSQITSFKIDYNIVQGTKYRTGSCMVASAGGGIVTFTDDYNENSLMNVYLYANQTGDIVTFNYNTTPPSGLPSTFYYSVSYLN